MKRFLSAMAFTGLIAVSACAPQSAPPAERKPVVQRANPAVEAAPVPASPSALPGLSNIPQNIPTVKVALLLPLSGESQALGSDLLDAAMLALYDAYVSLPPEQIKARLVLIPKDTGTSPTVAAQVARQALEQGATLLIGPLYSQSVKAVAPLARAKGVTVLALSNNRAVAGEGVYVYGFLPEAQVKRVADYAASKGLQNFASLVPNDAYGTSVADVFKATVAAKGGSVVGDERYARNASNMQAAVTRLGQQAVTQPFKGLFLADSGENASSLFTMLEQANLPRASYQPLGTGQWDEDTALKIPGLQGAWFASSAPSAYNRFEKRFIAAYGYKPKRLSSLAYDAVSMAAALTIAAGAPDFSPASLTQEQGFQGPANGAYRIRSDGVTDRALSVLEINKGGVRVLEAAPRMLRE